MLCAAQVMLEESGFVEPGVRHTVRTGLQCPERVITPAAEFELAEASKRSRRGAVISLLESNLLMYPLEWRRTSGRSRVCGQR